jgi:hypothetical protein
MRERAISTIAIWFSLAISIHLLLERLTYMDYQTVDGRQLLEPVVVQAPVFWQIAIFFLIFFLICSAGGATYFIWEKANKDTQNSQQKLSKKQKRDQKERVQRLLEQMDGDDLAALENGLLDDGEIMSVEEMLELQRRR